MRHPGDCPPCGDDVSCFTSQFSAKDIEAEWIKKFKIAYCVGHGHRLTAGIRFTFTREQPRGVEVFIGMHFCRHVFFEILEE